MSSREQFIENVIRVVVPDFAQPPRRLRQPVGSFRVSLERSRSAVIEGATSNVGGGLGWLKNGFRKGQWGHRANFSRAWFLWRALMLVWWLGASALAVLVMPQTLQNAARQLGGEPVRAGGIGLLVGPAGLLAERWKRDPALVDQARTGMDVAFIAMLFLTSLTGIALLLWRDTAAMGPLLALHLGVVFALFITMPYGKFVHGLYRYAALVRYAHERRRMGHV